MKNVSLTSRIVGAIVILSLGIIFIPVLLETDKIDSGNMNVSPIPEVPNEISTIVFQLNEATGKFEEEGVSSAKQFEAQVVKEIENSTNEVEFPEKQVAEEQSVEKSADKVVKKAETPENPDNSQHSWVLQVASFKDQQKALALRDKLRKQQYVAHISERKQDAGSIWRVRIGPDLSKSNIQKIQSILDKEMGLRGLIIRRR